MVRVPYTPDYNAYRAHYGGNLPVFRGYNLYGQRGAGFFGNLLQKSIPIVKSGAKLVGKQLLKTGSNVLSDVVSGNTNFETALRKRGAEALTDVNKSLVTKIKSNIQKNYSPPIKKQKSNKNNQPRRPQKKKRRQNKKLDIFDK
jgi:hypothetical protein